jgi:TM2 domain-containing membrane protein YozV
MRTPRNVANQSTILISASVRGAAQAQQIVVMKAQKNAGVAAVLSFVWAGLGQIYNGEISKGIELSILYFISVLLMFVGRGNPEDRLFTLIGFVTTPILWIIGIVNAYKTAERLNAAAEVSSASSRKATESGSLTGGTTPQVSTESQAMPTIQPQVKEATSNNRRTYAAGLALVSLVVLLLVLSLLFRSPMSEADKAAASARIDMQSKESMTRTELSIVDSQGRILELTAGSTAAARYRSCMYGVAGSTHFDEVDKACREEAEKAHHLALHPSLTKTAKKSRKAEVPSSTVLMPPQVASSGFSVLIKAKEDSWVSVVADGRSVVQEVLRADNQKLVWAGKTMILRTGNAGGIDVSFDGKSMGALGDTNEPRTLTFNPSGPIQ